MREYIRGLQPKIQARGKEPLNKRRSSMDVIGLGRGDGNKINR